MSNEELIELANKGRERAYTPYSHFAVGAALEADDGKVFLGCNIENAAFSPTNCAERTAVFTAVGQGYRKFKRIAIVGGPEGKPCTEICAPCGVCRQVLNEFVNADEFEVILGAEGKDTKVYTLSELLPEGFGPKNLE